MPNNQETLINAGFDPSEAEIYEIFIKNGELDVPKLQEYTDLSRATIYESLASLMAGGYIDYRKEGRRAFYRPNHPNKLFNLAEDKKQEAVQFSLEMGSLVEHLTGAFNLSSNKPGVRFFEGIEGIKDIYKDTLAIPKSNRYSIISPTSADPDIQKWLKDFYIPQRIKKEIFSKAIISTQKETSTNKKKDQEYFRETRFISSKEFPLEIAIILYGKQKIAFISYGTKELIGFIIESPAIYKSMRSFFVLAWQQANQIHNKA
jgi:HTH-type transcriptional regulator, sugar sensing transcriptional regulator